MSWWFAILPITLVVALVVRRSRFWQSVVEYDERRPSNRS